jgi:hypothetical protein
LRRRNVKTTQARPMPRIDAQNANAVEVRVSITAQ